MRKQVTDLGAQIARNNKLAVNATAEQRRNFAEKNRAIRAEQGLLRIQQQRSTQHLANLKQEARETRNAANATGGWTRSLRGLTTVVDALGIGALAAGVGQFARNTVQAAGRLSLLTTGLENVTGSSAAAEQRLTELDAIARLPGANLDTLIQYNNRLTAIGLTGEEIDSVLLNVGQSIVSLGGNAVLADQSLEQISQALQQNTVDLRDFRPVIQRVPGFLQAVADVHGVDASLDGLRVAVNNLGGSVKDALLPVLEELGDRFQAPPPESYVRSVDELQNAYFLFSATLGGQVLPAVSATARGLAALFDHIREGIEGTDETRVALVNFREALNNADTVLERGDAINARISHLENLKTALFDAANELDKFDRRGRERLQGAVEDANEEIGMLTLIQSGDIGVAQLQSEIEDLIDAYSELVAEETKREAQTLLTHLAVSNVAAARLIGIREEKSEVADQIEQYQEFVKVAEAAERGLDTALKPDTTSITTAGEALDALGETQAITIQRTKELAGAIITAEQAHRNLTAVVDSTNLAYNDFQSRIQASALAVARFTGEIEGVEEPFTAYTAAIHASTTALEDEAAALATVTQRIIQQTQDAEALVHIQGVLTERTDAHNAALVNPAISDAADSLRTYSDALSDVGVNFETLEDISQDVTDAIREQGTGFQTLRDNVESAEISLGDIDETMREIDEGAGVAEGSITNLDRAFGRLGSNIIDFVEDIASGGDVEDAFVNLGLTVGDAFVSAFEQTLNEDLSGVVTDALGGTSAVAGGAGSSIAASLASALTPVAVLAGSIYTLANVVDGFVGAVEFEGREAVQVGDQTLRPIAEIRLDQEDPFFTNLRDLLSQFGGVELLQSTGNTLDRPEVRQFIRDEFPELARELFSSRGLQGGEGAQNAQQFIAANNIIRGLTPGQDDQERGVVFDPNAVDPIVDAVEETTAVIEEALAGSEAGAGAAAESQGRAERDILGTNVGRAQLNLGQSTDEGDFEGDRQALIGTINAVHAAEAARIDGLLLGETALKALRDANDLDRDIALQRATGLENTFTTQRIKNEMDVAEAATDAAQARIDGIEAAAAVAMKAADAAATATERQRTADSNAQRSLLGTGVSSAVFDLRESGSEGEFEANRQRAILLTVAYYAAENERINGLKGSETELAALRDANDLARRIALGRLTGLENTFTTQRIKNEMSVAEAATEAAEAAIAATEKRAAAAMKAAEAEAEAQRRAAEAAEVAAERQRGRESDAAAGLLQTGVGQARFDLGLSGSEGEFEINRQGLIDAANAYYDNELARINELGLLEIELDDRRKANELNRQMALSRAITTTNSFTTARVRAEERALDEIERMRDDAIDAEERRLDTIQDLKDDAFDAEQDRADALVDLEQDTQDRITDIIRNANRSKEDIERDFQDAYQDIQQQRGEGTLTDDDANAQLLELGRERIRDLRDVGIRTGRREEDADIRQQRGERDISSEASERLIGIQQQTAALESETAAVNAIAAVMTTEATQVLSDASMQSVEAAMGLGTAGDNLETAAEALQSAARVQGLFDAAAAVQSAAGALSMAAGEFGTVTRGLSLLIGGFLATFETVNTALDTGMLAIADTTQPALMPSDMTQPIPVEIANTDDIYTSALRAGTMEGTMMGAMNAFADASDMLPVEPAAIPPLTVNSVSITAGSVSVSGNISGGSGTGDGEVVLNANINNTLTLPDGATAELGSNQHRLRAQRRSS